MYCTWFSFLDSIASGGRSSGTEAGLATIPYHHALTSMLLSSPLGDTAAFMSSLPRGYQLVQQLLYDTFMLGYFRSEPFALACECHQSLVPWWTPRVTTRAYSGDERFHVAAADAALDQASSALMRLAVIRCADVVAWSIYLEPSVDTGIPWYMFCPRSAGLVKFSAHGRLQPQ